MVRSLVLVLVGCGRIGFTETVDPDLVFDHPDFATCPIAQLQLNGTARCVNGALQLNSVAGGAGSAFVRVPFAFGPQTTIETDLTLRFEPTDALPGDGLTFAIHSSPVGATALGDGGGLGFYGIAKGVAVEFDTFRDEDPAEPSNNHVGFDESAGNVSATTVPLAMSTGEPFAVRIEYDGATNFVRVFMAAGSAALPTVPVFTHVTDLSNKLDDSVFIGVTAGTAFAVESHEVLAWRLVVTP